MTAPRRPFGVVGAGVMGAGLAEVAARAGHPVVVWVRSASSATAGRERLLRSLRRRCADGAQADSLAARVTWTTDPRDLTDARIVVESVPERIALKEEVFAQLDKVCARDTVLATNTSGLSITRIAAATTRPELVLGCHFFSPVPAMRLCELVRGATTADTTVRTAQDLVAGLGKTTIVVDRDVAGFVTTRLMAVLVLEAARLVDGGIASAADIDTACRLGFGHAAGPLETADGAGLDTLVDVAAALRATDDDARFAVPRMLERLVAAGRWGRKSGAGFHEYADARS